MKKIVQWLGHMDDAEYAVWLDDVTEMALIAALGLAVFAGLSALLA